MTGQTAVPQEASHGSGKDLKLSTKKLATHPDAPPAGRPHFTVADIRKAIPEHCFERSALRSFAHLGLDLAIVAVLGMLGVKMLSMEMPLAVKCVVWPLYWYAQGSVMTGVWVMAHECGHQAFSAHKWLNNAVGMVCHSALLVPYHSWRISHGNHHKNTCSMENDEVFVPPTRADFDGMEVVEHSPLWNLIGVLKMLVFGWPMYLLLNVAGPAKYRNQPNSHFNPHSALFKASQAPDITKSDIGIFVAMGVFAYCVLTFGWNTVCALYFIPYLVVNAHLVLITYLQHTAPYIPHYRNDEFDWLRGALSTVDRSFGPVLNHVFHHITDTHVAHHLFHQMPFYHAQEATEAIKSVLGPYYLKDETPILKSLLLSWRECRCVENTGSILHFKSE